MLDWLAVRVVRSRLVAQGVREFSLQSVVPDQLGAWEAGAHVRVRVQKLGRRVAERQYSLVWAAEKGKGCVIAVHRAHDYGVSAFLHDHIQVEDVLEISQPLNDFPLHPGAQRSVLIAGGIGITPILPMAYELSGLGRPFELHYAARSSAEMAYLTQVKALASPSVHLYLGDSSDRLDVGQLAPAWRGEDHIYVCGPRGLIDAVNTEAFRVGLSQGQIHFESFGPVSRPSDREFTVELRRSRKVLQVARGETVLQAMTRDGLYATSDCLRGECGVCATRFVEGEVDHRDICLTQSDRHTARLMTPCVSRAAGPHLVLDL